MAPENLHNFAHLPPISLPAPIAIMTGNANIIIADSYSPLYLKYGRMKNRMSNNEQIK